MKERQEKMAKHKKLTRQVALVLFIATILTTVFSLFIAAWTKDDKVESPLISLFEGDLITNRNDYLNSQVFFELPNTIKGTDEIAIIVKTNGDSLLDAYGNTSKKYSFSDYAKTFAAENLRKDIAKHNEKLIAMLDKSGIDYEVGASYDTFFRGFEIVITADQYKEVCDTLGNYATLIVSGEYEKMEYELVENTVDVYSTGIFDSSDFAYQGAGMVIAVLDTGLDYDHSAFSNDTFLSLLGGKDAAKNKIGLTYDEVADIIKNKDLVAEKLYPGLTAGDVYLNEKVPYSFDYADHDPDVFPIQSDHGTHVSGIIVGKDDTITGVAPQAQLVSMKIFSDTQATARATWILDALEDCVTLGVNVINMSIGTGCGFSHETMKELERGVYQQIHEAGISLIVAASNSFNSTYGSVKNGNLGLTSNPDSGTIGSPGTYPGALAVASISGTPTPYLLYNNEIIYFVESSDRVSEEKNFVEDLLDEGTNEAEMEYITIPGVGRNADYTGLDVSGKIVLIARGDTTFEEKANIAEKQGAAAVIIYNNVSGDIKMNVGDTKIAVCSISQDQGEMLAAQKTGKIKISRSQTAGPFMSDFSSWGPNPNLELKPEITAHGGSILSSVPGQDYDRISGTSMATPNIAGLVALVRQYVIANFPEIANDATAVTKLINQLVMSTADVIYNKNGLPYSVRKQGAGLANLTNSATTKAYIITYKNGEEMDKTKIELGDDPNKTGIYTLSFAVKNFGTASLSYDVQTFVMTEGVSDTKTYDGETTVTEEAYILDGAKIEISVSGGGSLSGERVTVNAGSTANVTVKVTLSDKDKKYLDDSFENGMYVEGFVRLNGTTDTTVDLGVPYLAFYGDWTKAPLFDIDYFETNADELDDSIALLDKTLPDAYATRPIGGTNLDFISYLGTYAFNQSPTAKKIAADRKYISLSNNTDSINSLRFVWAGLLRNATRVEVTITDDATGEVVYTTTDYDIRKSYGDGGSIYPTNIDIEFSAIEQNLKNNTTYSVKLQGYLDYADGGVENNLSSTFEFPVVTDFTSPAITGCEFYTEYDRANKETRLFAKMAVYDNHYSQALQIGYVGYEHDSEGNYILDSSGARQATFMAFDHYLTPVYSNVNSTTYVTYELTDYIDDIKANACNKNTFAVIAYDYALNQGVYEIELPDDYAEKGVYFAEDPDMSYHTNEDGDVCLELNPYEVYDLRPLVYPGTEWPELITFESADPSKAVVVGNQVVPIKSGYTAITAKYPNQGSEVPTLYLYIREEGDDGYRRYDKPVAEDFTLTGYYVDKAFYFLATDERDIGLTGDERKFTGSNYSLSMYPSEAVTIRYNFKPYFKDDCVVEFTSSNSNIVTVDKDTGKITAVAEGFASVSVRVKMDGKNTYYSNTIPIEVKDPYVTTGPGLTSYFGLGGVVEIPESLAVTEISQYAFSNYDYIAKGPNDEISEDAPELTKIWYIGNPEITKVVIPEGVERIGPYAFAGCTNLKEVELPSTLVTIDMGAFYDCENLRVVKGIENVKFFNQNAFAGCKLAGKLNLTNAVAIADYAFASAIIEIKDADNNVIDYKPTQRNEITEINLAEGTKSVGAYAFYDLPNLEKVTIGAEKIKLGQGVFMDCPKLNNVSVNASVIPAYAFYDCKALANITLGKDVESIGEYAFKGTNISSFTVKADNATFKAPNPGADNTTVGKFLTNKDGTVLMLVAPMVYSITESDFGAQCNIYKIADGAFSGNTNIETVNIPSVVEVGNYAFAVEFDKYDHEDRSKLNSITLGKLTFVGAYSFFGTAITAMPEFDASLNQIGDYAFAFTKITNVTIPDGFTVGEGAFTECKELKSVTIGDNVKLGTGAFMLGRDSNYRVDHSDGTGGFNENIKYWKVLTSKLDSITIGENVTLGNNAFMGASVVETITLGEGAYIGDMAFYNASSLTSIDISKATHIGKNSFSGDVFYVYSDAMCTTPYITSENTYEYTYHAPKLAEVTISAEEISEGAFAYSRKLTTVNLEESVKTIGLNAFRDCEALTTVNLEKVENIGENAFAEASLTTADLSSAKTIGKYAFVYNETLDNVVLPTEAYVIEEGAFAYCQHKNATTGEVEYGLTNVENLKYATSIGKYAFAYTKIEEADLSGAEHIGEGAFFKENATPFKVTLGENLKSLGDNPFANCRLEAFTRVVKETFNGKDYETTVYTFDISDTVKVIDGILYQSVPYGLELVSYAGDNGTVNVADNTVRISAMAFASSEVNKIVFPHTLNSIGHKAFYGCNKLALVSFASYNAPVLEEEYDESYWTNGNNLPATGDYDFITNTGEQIQIPGLGIVPYYMWNVTSNSTNFYFGANFVDYVGKVTTPIVMIRPENGVGYDSFIYQSYFNLTIDGASAADDVTLNAIALINGLPENVALKDEALVIAAREAYNKIASLKQQALVTNYDALTRAEKRISDLKYLAGDNTPDVEPTPEAPDNTGLILAIVFSVLGVVLVGGGVAAVIIINNKNPEFFKNIIAKLTKKDEKKDDKEVNAPTETNDTEKTVTEDDADNA